MALMAGLLASAEPRLYPGTYSAIWKLTQDSQRLGCVVGSGVCLFVGLIALYFSLSQVVAGVAIALFFIYPAITLLLAWKFLKQRPRAYQLGFMVVIFLGVMLTTQGEGTDAAALSSSVLGILSALLAGLSFGIYGIFAEIVLQPAKSAQRQQQYHRQALHPVPFSLATFGIVSTLGGISLLFMPSIDVRALPTCAIILAVA